MEPRDPYGVLGVDRGADGDDIKKAYRRLAKELHPDRNKGDETAAERFKDVNAAYEILKDPQKRAAYDRFGHAAFGNGGGRGSHGAGPDIESAFSDLFGDIFGDIMGGRAGGQQRRASRGEDLRYDIAIDLDEAYSGTRVNARFPAPALCETCAGTGSASQADPVACTTCGGGGVLRTQQHFMSFQRTCPACHGEGSRVPDPCRACRGNGRVERIREVEIKVPAGIDDGNRLQMRGEGAPGPRGAPAGDLYISVRVRPHPRFQRRDRDLLAQLSVPMTTAALGGEVRAPTVDGGWTKVRVPAGTQSGKQLRLRGKGMPQLHGKNPGDLYLDVHVPTPQRMSRKQKQLLEEFAAEEEKDDGGRWGR